MPFSGLYPCMDKKVPIRLVRDRRVADPSTMTKVFIEVQVREKQVYRTRSGVLLNHLHVSSPLEVRPPNKYLSSWRLFQIDFDNLLAEDVFLHCCDGNSLFSMRISENVHSAARFVNFFKRRVSSFCKKIAEKLVETKPKSATIVTRITTVRVFDLDDDSEAEHSLKVCGESCITRKKNLYLATRLPKTVFLFSPVYGSLAFKDFVEFYGETCATCLDELTKDSDIIKICCGHAFHSRCLIPWFNKVGTCPLCRRRLKIIERRKNSSTYCLHTVSLVHRSRGLHHDRDAINQEALVG